MTLPYDQRWTDARIYGHFPDDLVQTFSHQAPDLGWSGASAEIAEFEGSVPNDVPISSYLAPRTQVNVLAMQGGSTRATSTSL
ncbi:hypothetical protein PENANT_c007G03633 [Penicillium antarcticum]|uniref:Uncharacterized protein n=1 Tax=Penicillium antarcticum TaxID=416450 RepID=A0A1V6QBY4_9EURO|nr:hypothetical protein PENANT_c007G03633 [Penicillium antarcticum]